MKIFIICFVLVIIGAIIILLFSPLSKYIEKKFFSRIVGKKLYHLAGKNDFLLLHNVNILAGENIHATHVLCGDKFIYVITDKYIQGGITGNVDDEKLFVYTSIKSKKALTNPVRYNEMRVSTLAKLLSGGDVQMWVSIVVCNDSLYIDTVLQEQLHQTNSFLINARDIVKVISKLERKKVLNLDVTSMQEIVQRMQKESAINNNKEFETKKK